MHVCMCVSVSVCEYACEIVCRGSNWHVANVVKSYNFFCRILFLSWFYFFTKDPCCLINQFIVIIERKEELACFMKINKD